MATDPICGMFVREDADALRSTRDGATYYFCSRQCLVSFEQPERDHRWLRATTIAAWFVGAALLLVMFLPRFGFEAADHDARMRMRNWLLLGLATPIQFVAGARFYQGFFHAVRARAANMDTLIAIGTTAAYAYSAAATLVPGRLGTATYFDVSVLVIAFILLGRTLEHAMKRRATGAIRKLLDLRPRHAILLIDGHEREIPVEELRVGQRFRVRAGERVSTDGRIVDGQAAMDESMVTGESVPVAKGVGQDVVGGTLNTSGLLVVEARRVGQDTALAQIATLVERAQAGRAPIQRLVDAVSSYFVPLVVVVAVISFLAWWLYAGLAVDRALLPAVAVLIIACPCALGLATPAALLVTVARGAENGVLVKETDQLEALARVDTVLFDKTGTLTTGAHEVAEVVPAPGPSADEVLRVAASAEQGSRHPLAQAMVREARRRNVRLSDALDYEERAGHGVRARIDDQPVRVGTEAWLAEAALNPDVLRPDRDRLRGEGRTVLHVARGTQLIGLVALTDEVKPGASEAVHALQAAGVDVILVSGDHKRTTDAVAERLGIRRAYAEILPDGKARLVEEFRAGGHRVAMVGDGINDAPALAAADVGIALGGGTDIAMEAGGLVLLKDDPRDVANTVMLARRGLRKIRQNLFWAFAYNVALIPVAAFGVLHPIWAGAAMGLSSVTVVGNSLLLRRFRPPLESAASRGVKGGRGERPKPRRQLPMAPMASTPGGDAVDPVCGMTVASATTRWRSTRAGRAYFFCSPGCLAEFEKEPARFGATTGLGSRVAGHRRTL